ncbi:hypothetical protein B7R22_02465 [Subtercola boreus]|uniref:Xylose isomerase-like TIM barrel domain-containing protein n=1 Tax=Subtercola boreus TaxID=120213 RepID=A0A3E0W5G5_9MICO|nr:sugar phosphate isomerase/epimerase [Subtercola boreus]RFA16738.1 hypothetical protein B7R22_02465 [Subtercola boreus]
MTTISYMGANLVAQQLDWNMSDGWMQGDAAANMYYEPIDTFADRFGAFVGLVVDSGFSSLDVWSGQLNWRWATPAHLDAASAALRASGVSVTSYAGFLGETPEDFAASCALAAAIGAPLMSGRTSLLTDDRQSLFRILRSTGRKLAIENHPETSTQQMIELIGSDGDDLLGTAVDTGWWATHGVDAAEAVRELAPFTFHVHLKDIRAVGAHDSCAFGEGIVPLESCAEILGSNGFDGPISVEHEPEHSNPKDDVIRSRVLLEQWLSASLASK